MRIFTRIPFIRIWNQKKCVVQCNISRWRRCESILISNQYYATKKAYTFTRSFALSFLLDEKLAAVTYQDRCITAQYNTNTIIQWTGQKDARTHGQPLESSVFMCIQRRIRSDCPHQSSFNSDTVRILSVPFSSSFLFRFSLGVLLKSIFFWFHINKWFFNRYVPISLM